MANELITDQDFLGFMKWAEQYDPTINPEAAPEKLREKINAQEAREIFIQLMDYGNIAVAEHMNPACALDHTFAHAASNILAVHPTIVDEEMLKGICDWIEKAGHGRQRLRAARRDPKKPDYAERLGIDNVLIPLTAGILVPSIQQNPDLRPEWLVGRMIRMTRNHFVLREDIGAHNVEEAILEAFKHQLTEQNLADAISYQPSIISAYRIGLLRPDLTATQTNPSSLVAQAIAACRQRQ